MSDQIMKIYLKQKLNVYKMYSLTLQGEEGVKVEEGRHYGEINEVLVSK